MAISEKDDIMTVRPEAMSVSFEMERLEKHRKMHEVGGLYYEVLAAIEKHMPENPQYTAETGCGRSTVFFSNLAKHHTYFCLDDRLKGEGSSVKYYEDSDLFKPENTAWVVGPTQETLPKHEHVGQYDCVLIDGPHGYPFPDLEYFYFYPHIKEGGLLIIDDVHIASIGRMADIIQEDAMWQLEEVVKTTAIFRRTPAQTFCNRADGWWEQGYNQRRTYRSKPFFLEDGRVFQNFYDRYFSHVKKPGKGKPKGKLARLMKFLRR